MRKKFIKKFGIIISFISIVAIATFTSSCALMEQFTSMVKAPVQEPAVQVKTESKPDPFAEVKSVRSYTYYGHIAWVKQLDNHVLIKPNNSSYDFFIGKKLYCFKLNRGLEPEKLTKPPLSKITAIVKLTPQRNGDFITADIIKGTPTIGDSAYLREIKHNIQQNLQNIDDDEEITENEQPALAPEPLTPTPEDNKEEIKELENEVEDILSQ